MPTMSLDGETKVPAAVGCVRTVPGSNVVRGSRRSHPHLFRASASQPTNLGRDARAQRETTIDLLAGDGGLSFGFYLADRGYLPVCVVEHNPQAALGEQ